MSRDNERSAVIRYLERAAELAEARADEMGPGVKAEMLRASADACRAAAAGIAAGVHHRGAK